jgi:TnpA family transposase
MTPIERTAYPVLNADRIIPPKKLQVSYLLLPDEIQHIKNSVRTNMLRLYYALQLKSYQELGYFVDIKSIPIAAISYVKKQLGIPHNLQVNPPHTNTIYRHRQSIRNYLNMIPWGLSGSKSARRVALNAALRAARTLTIPADIINVVIETLRREHCELPAFSVLCRLVRHIRFGVNKSIFKGVYQKLQAAGTVGLLETLLKVPDGKLYSPYQTLKEPPKSSRINDFKDLINHNIWLLTLGDMEPFIKSITKPKRLQFAQEAKSHDISSLLDLTEEKRYTLIVCLIDHHLKKTKDTLAEVICKIVKTVHKRARRELETLREKKTMQTQEVAHFAYNIISSFKDKPSTADKFLKQVTSSIKNKGGVDKLSKACEEVIASHTNHHYALLWPYFKSRRSALFNAIEAISLGSSTQNKDLLNALNFLIKNRHRRSDKLEIPKNLSLNFISKHWMDLAYGSNPKRNFVNRRYFEICIFTYLSNELISGDIFINGADAYSDYRASLLSVTECQEHLLEEPEESILCTTAHDFVTDLKNDLLKKSKDFDKAYHHLTDFRINDKGIPYLKRNITVKPAQSTLEIVAKVHKAMPERSLLDILCRTHHSTGWAFEFGPISGMEARFKKPIDRYITNAFCYGTGMGPSQTAKHMHNSISPSMLSWVNQRHSNIKIIGAAKDRLVNCSTAFHITQAWGDGSRCAADGTMRDIHEDNIIAESHFRYLKKGGVQYNHIADTYIALFSTFMRCGLWEAVAILEGLLENKSELNPTTIHADTQGQSTVVFALAYLLGIKLMPRIRNWKDTKFFRPDKATTYKNIDSLFTGEIDWELIKEHWQDLLQVVISIKHGKISSALLLRKLGTYSRKNRLYLAFQELGRVIRTSFLLEYLSNSKLRGTIDETTNKVEAYNALSDWVRFGAQKITASNDPDEMEKAIGYNLLVCNSVILQNMVDLTDTIHKLQKTGVPIGKEDIARLSPYLTGHIKRFGDYVLDLDTVPQDIEIIKNLSLF